MFVGASSRVITDDDVAAGVVLAVAVAVGVAETGVCVVGEAVTVETVGDGETVGETDATRVAVNVAGDVGEAAGDGDGDGNAAPCVGVAVGGDVGTGVFAGEAVGFAVVGVGVVTCAVADGCADATLGVTVAVVAAVTRGTELPPSATPATRRDAADRRKPATRRRRRADCDSLFARNAVTSFPVICAKTASTPILTRAIGVRYATPSNLSSNCEKSVRTCSASAARSEPICDNTPACYGRKSLW